MEDGPYFKGIMDVFQESLILFGQRGVILGVNTSFCQLLGWEREQLEGLTPDYHFVPEDQRGRLYTWMGNAQALQNPLDLEFLSRDGKRLAVTLEPSWLTAKEGTDALAVLVGMQEETSNRRKAYLADSLLENLDQAVISTSVVGIVRSWNRAAEKIYGIEKSKAIGKPVKQIVPQERVEELHSWLEKMYASGKPSHRKTSNVRANGDLFAADMSICPIFSDSGSILGICLIVRDISQESALEMRFRRMEKELLENQRAKSLADITSGIATANNNILQVLSGQVSGLLATLPSSDSLYPRLEHIDQAVNKLVNFNKNLIEFTRGGQAMYENGNLEVTNPGEVLRSVVEICRDTFPPTITIIEKFSKASLPLAIDSTELKQLVMNLMSNARDALPKGGVIELVLEKADIGDRGEILKIPVSPGDYMMIQVKDNGEGVAPKMLSRLFDPMSSTKGAEKGHGFGLYYVRNIVKKRKGYIEAIPGIPRGTTFEVYLPVSAPKETKSPSQSQGTLERGNETVLLVDDEELIISMGESILKSLGYQVIVAHNGLEAVQTVEKRRADIDVVVMDVIMPKMDGLEALRKIKQRAADLPVVISTGFADIAPMGDIKKAGADQILLKPYKIDDLASMLKEVFKKKYSGDGDSDDELVLLDPDEWNE